LNKQPFVEKRKAAYIFILIGGIFFLALLFFYKQNSEIGTYPNVGTAVEYNNLVVEDQVDFAKRYNEFSKLNDAIAKADSEKTLQELILNSKNLQKKVQKSKIPGQNSEIFKQALVTFYKDRQTVLENEFREAIELLYKNPISQSENERLYFLVEEINRKTDESTLRFTDSHEDYAKSNGFRLVEVGS